MALYPPLQGMTPGFEDLWSRSKLASLYTWKWYDDANSVLHCKMERHFVKHVNSFRNQVLFLLCFTNSIHNLSVCCCFKLQKRKTLFIYFVSFYQYKNSKIVKYVYTGEEKKHTTTSTSCFSDSQTRHANDNVVSVSRVVLCTRIYPPL